MRRWQILFLALLVAPLLAMAQTSGNRPISGWCTAGATSASTQGLPSTNKLQGIVPRCTVGVYLTGTTTLAVIYADPVGTPLGNPFTATDAGQWTVWANPAVAYDITMKGGTPPNVFPVPVTLNGIQVAGAGAGGSPSGNPNELQFNAGGFFAGTTSLTWTDSTKTLDSPSGTIGAGTFNGPMGNFQTINSSGTINGNVIKGNGIDVKSGGFQVEIPWNTGQPSMANGLLGCTTGTGTVYACPVNSATWNGIQVAGGPGSGSAQSTLVVSGQASCIFDGTATVGDYVQLSQTTAGVCHDSGSTTLPTNGVPVVGQVAALGVAPLATVLLAPSGASSTPGPAGPAGPAGPPGGSLSYPGVTSDNQQGLQMPGTITATASGGYRQNPLNARARNRDEVLQITISPQDMQGCQQSGQGFMDDTPCINAAIAYLNSADKGAIKRLILPWTPKGYSILSYAYLVTLPYDYGDYHGFASSTNAGSVSPSVVNGAVVSCSVSGGTGYAPNANMQVAFQDPAIQGTGGPPSSGAAYGSGATATVQTNSSGVATGCTVTNGGMNYPSVGTVAFIIPAGGDGAAATVQMTSGVIAASSVVLTSSGSGYSGTSVPINVPGLTGCNPFPAFTAVLTGTTITSVTNTAGGTTTPCNSSATSNLSLSFGASCGGVQCTLMAPETPVDMPCAVAVPAGITIEGVGNPLISTGWDFSKPMNSSQTIAFCEPSGTASYNLTFKNFTVNAYIDFYFPYEAMNVTWDHMSFSGGLPVYAYSFGTYASSNGHFSFPKSTITNSVSNSMVPGVVCSAAWAGRNPPANAGNSVQAMALLLGVVGRLTYVYNQTGYNNPDYGGRCSSIDVTNFTAFPPGASQTQLNAFDSWFEAAIWKTQNGPTNANTYTDATHLLSNGLASGWGSMGGAGCKITQTVTDRTADYNFGYAPGGNTWVGGYPYYQCYPGVTNTFFTAYPRYSSNDSQVPFGSGVIPPQLLQGLVLQNPNRAVVNGRFDFLRVVNVAINYCGATFTDPYKQTGQTVYAYNMTGQVLSATQVINHTASCQNAAGVSSKANVLLFGVANISSLFQQNVAGVAIYPTQTVNTPAFVTMPTAAIAAGLCSTTVTAANANVTTSDLILWGYSGALGGSVGLLHLNAWPTTGNVNFNFCNPTSASITPASTSIWWKVIR
jgi:hypothetical protein